MVITMMLNLCEEAAVDVQQIAMNDFVLIQADWPAERVWHVLSGLGDQRSGLVAAPDGGRLLHGRATGFSLEPSRPGHLEVESESYRVHCKDGVVDLARLPEGRG